MVSRIRLTMVVYTVQNDNSTPIYPYIFILKMLPVFLI